MARKLRDDPWKRMEWNLASLARAGKKLEHEGFIELPAKSAKALVATSCALALTDVAVKAFKK